VTIRFMLQAPFFAKSLECDMPSSTMRLFRCRLGHAVPHRMNTQQHRSTFQTRLPTRIDTRTMCHAAIPGTFGQLRELLSMWCSEHCKKCPPSKNNSQSA